MAINYSDQGYGDVIVVLHGWGTRAADLTALTQQLARTYRVLALDLPGFGGSQQPTSVWSVGEYAQFVADFLAKHNIESVAAMIGHSFGGRIVIKACGSGTLQPKKIVLIGAAGIRHSQSIRNLGYKLAAKAGKAVFALPIARSYAANARSKLYRHAGSTDYDQSGAMREIFLKTINEDLQSDAAHITQPTLLIWGQNDAESPVEDARKFHSIIRNSVLHVIPDAGHFVHHDQPTKVWEYIGTFLS